MNAYLCALFAMLAVCLAHSLALLQTGITPPPLSARQLRAAVAVQIALIAWTAYLLFSDLA